MGAHLREEEVWFWVGFGTAASASTMLAYFGHWVAGYIVLALALLLGARFAYALANGVFTVDLLMSIVGFVGHAIGAVLETSMVYVLYAVAEASEAYVESLARRRISMLESLLPSRVLVKKGKGVREEPLDEVRPGDVIIVRPGEVIPVDGVSLSPGLVDTRFVTGEHERRLVEPGDPVESGYINAGRSPLIVRALKPPSESLLAILVRTAEEVLERKTRIQRLIERIVPSYTLLVLAVFGLFVLLAGPYRGLTVLLAGCPSAFIVASSFTTVYSVSILATRSILVKGGSVLETLAHCNVVILDKTGTLTLGELRVAKVVPSNGFTARQVLKLACAAAKASRHPASQALAKECREAPEQAREEPGRGVVAVVSGHLVVMGSRGFVASHLGYEPPSPCRESKEVHVAIDGRYAGSICMEEELVENAKKVIDELRSMGLRVVIASGDRRDAVKTVADKLGVDEYYYGLKPHEKLELVRRLRARYNSPVAMLGDGINDVEALAEADVGIAVGGIDVVAEVADAILANGVTDLPKLIRYAYSFRNAITTSFAIAALVKTMSATLGLLGYLPLWVVAALGDEGATILGVLTSLLTIHTRTWEPRLATTHRTGRPHL
ncbi:heavy metal translocating P-type ATPase [Pyrolobus fumarii 1A]|uniref:Heavy metal translocating P-type ATPase n=1 Tax=Pyrolobus fumarii (strain DSM 11204 / 1A) TaxID=694429 RepID=G0EF71_PYRF1|nr:heavy metal translocating P-type ATPase [Pyrolobus fumarii]AEM38968.1 heavy metal translocating P-type ATPase [Pyrolobus fumarii 1A]